MKHLLYIQAFFLLAGSTKPQIQIGASEQAAQLNATRERKRKKKNHCKSNFLKLLKST